MIDGPLLQRASAVVSAPIKGQHVPLEVYVAQEVPTGFTGGWGRAAPGEISTVYFNRTLPSASGQTSNLILAFENTGISPTWSDPWLADAPFRNIVSGCRGTCLAKIRAPALAAVACLSRQIPVDYNQPMGQALNPEGGNFSSPPLDRYSFMFSADPDFKEERETIDLITAYATVQDCKGTLNFTTCNLASAIGEYGVEIRGSTVTLANPVPEIIALANNTKLSHVWNRTAEWYPSTLAGVITLAGVQFGSSASYVEKQHGKAPMGTIMGGGAASEHLIGDPHSTRGLCGSYSDPHNDVLASLNKLMFHIGVAAAKANTTFSSTDLDPGAQVHAVVDGLVQGEHNIFEMHFEWFVAAAIVELVSIAFILPTYWRWWEMGRPASFSPMEIAKAFEAPLLEATNSNSSGRDISGVENDTTLRYGVVRISPTDARTKLAFADAHLVEKPKRGVKFEV